MSTCQRRKLSARERLILAVDVSSVAEARSLLDELFDYVGVFKIGLELMLSTGPEILEIFQERGARVFFDTKLHDIPNTVAKAAEAVTRRRVNMFTVHATGGAKMLAATAEAVESTAGELSIEPPIILAVTVLTSISQEALAGELNCGLALPEQVASLAKLVQAQGVTGLVASAQEVETLRQAVGEDMVIVTPGIRPTWAGADDQARVIGPAEAIKLGADYLVIGRPITHAKDRVDAAKRILAEMETVC